MLLGENLAEPSCLVASDFAVCSGRDAAPVLDSVLWPRGRTLKGGDSLAPLLWAFRTH